VRRWETPLRQPLVPVGFWWGLGGVVALMILALTAAAWLRREVATKTGHLQESERKLATILDTVGACIFIKDRALRYVYANRQTQEQFGLPAEYIVGKGDEAFFDATTAEQLQASDRRVIEAGERVTSEDTNTTADSAEKRTYLAIKIPLRDTRGRIYGLCGIATDISERKRNEEAIYRLAYFDTLTGLPNRSLLMKQLRESLSTANQTSTQALIYIDLDDFKDLNDLHGHSVGDNLDQPGEFIPVAESSGLILGLGRWVLSTACRQLAKWEQDAAMAHLTLAVNVSARQFRSVGFVDDLLTIIQKTGATVWRIQA
jgi:PAS domain S-box-containing protein